MTSGKKVNEQGADHEFWQEIASIVYCRENIRIFARWYEDLREYDPGGEVGYESAQYSYSNSDNGASLEKTCEAKSPKSDRVV